ncbi:MAG: ABC transporter ATP-binding protein [Dehalococcoidia bacterium]|nr:ABC transporter ATP-binding protein [Dehalococcoidia bacterium]
MTQGHTSSPCTLEARQLSVVLGGQKVLEIPSLQLFSDETLVIIGPNGSGKTTLLLCMALLLRPTTGGIAFQGIPVEDGSSILRLRRRFAVVFQEPLLLDASVWDNVTLGLRLRGVRRGETKARAQEWLERFGIASLAKRRARTLSGGEAKRASLARAFALKPEVLFLDEPFATLDGPTRQSLIEDLGGVLRETKVSTIMVTHERNEALALANRVAVLMDGHVRQIGSPEDVFSFPVDEEVARFVDAGNVLHGVVGSQSEGLASVSIGGQQLYAVSSLAAGTRVAVYLHYEDVTISVATLETVPSSARNQLRGRIAKALPFASQMRVTVDCGFPLVSLITRRSWSDLGLEVGHEVVASLKASSIRLIPSL